MEQSNKLLMKEMPEGDRPYEKLERLGARAMSDAELLSVIIRSGTKQESALQLGQRIKASLELGNRTIDKARSTPRKQIKTPDDARSMLEEQLRSCHREELHMIMLDIRNRVIRTVRLSEGGLSSAVIQPRDLFREAVKANAASIILVHNHPSGDHSPSQDDIDSSLRLIEMGGLMGIRVIDHLVISLSGYISMKQEGMI